MSERFVQYIVFIIWKLVDHVLLYKNFECFSVCHAGDFIQSMLARRFEKNTDNIALSLLEFVVLTVDMGAQLYLMNIVYCHTPYECYIRKRTIFCR